MPSANGGRVLRIQNANPITDVAAKAFLNYARGYHEAADQLFNLSQDRLREASNKHSMNDPIRFLYFHTVELALKAFLRSQNLPILGTSRQTHRLTKLYEECRNLGLRIGADDRVGIGNIVGLLEKGNEDQAFRYFDLRSGVMADLSWVREVVGQLLSAVETHVDPYPRQDAAPGPVAKLTIIWGKPVPRS
jgi:hypothetical protein